MAPDLGGWIHSFAVTETQTHKAGFTLYKITSIVFPRSVPQALTTLVVWRRFHDIKKLHRDLKRRHKSLGLPGYMPEPIDCSFFKRFDQDVIRKRKAYIVSLLDFVAQHPALYKSHSFAQFFSSETTPSNKIHKLVQKAARSFVRSPEIEHDVVVNGKAANDDIAKYEILPDDNTDRNEEQAEEETEEEDTICGDGENINKDTITKTSGLSTTTTTTTKCNLRFLTPMASVESEDSDYIYDAALEFSSAVQAEANLDYNDAYMRYKSGVDILLKGCKDDLNEDRVYIARAKITKYLARAEDIHERFLKTSQRSITSIVSTSNFQLALDVSCNTNSESSGFYLERPWNHMAKYKVNALLGNKVLLVSCITEPLKPKYVMKGIEKPSSNSPTQTVFLPQHVPYMVDLLAFFQSDQKIFLLLKLALGGNLIDYVHSQNQSNAIAAAKEKPCDGDITSSDTVTDPMNSDSNVQDLVESSKQLIESVSNTINQSEFVPRLVNGILLYGIPQHLLKKWSQQLLVAIHALHEKSVILCDLHMDNLLLDEDGQLLLTYFYQNEGISSDSFIHKALNPKALDNHFVAPERPLTLRSDWWSYGVILYELFVGLPFKAAHPGQIDLYGFVQYPENIEIPKVMRNLLEKLLQQEPEERLDYERIKQHEYFEDTNWEEIRQEGFNCTTSENKN
ncbi:ribosomal protein S6 kinase delta-1 [Musca vetustissima]|uniref:ribosomal protein S6 kinase delta-1 n=1 Tax=Musca vetustissima TaxID=27455 RepID=UPI002AB65C3B|nr:ribosomal protein S6 kinase delta-1 [Musca vetustissima]